MNLMERLTGSTAGEVVEPKTYFRAIELAGHQKLNDALDDFITSAEEEDKLWSSYRSRLADTLDPTIRVNAEYGLSQKHRGLLQALLQYSSDDFLKKLESNEWAISRPTTDRCAFSKHGNSWTLCFEGKVVTKVDVDGLFYIANLLVQPGKEIAASVLRSALFARQTAAASNFHRQNLVEAIDAISSKKEEEGEAEYSKEANDLGEAWDEDATKDFNKELQRIEGEIEAAKKSHNMEEATRLGTSLQELKESVSKNTRPGGQSQLMKRKIKQDHDAVCNAVNRVLVDLKEAHPKLYKHLNECLCVGSNLSYKPKSPVSWEF